jgi:hypothetical protein
MNELIGNSKIYALAKEAGLIEFEQFAWNPELGSPTYESVAKARKFAESIVMECTKILADNSEFKGCVIIVKHFGVEE